MNFHREPETCKNFTIKATEIKETIAQKVASILYQISPTLDEEKEIVILSDDCRFSDEYWDISRNAGANTGLHSIPQYDLSDRITKDVTGKIIFFSRPRLSDIELIMGHIKYFNQLFPTKKSFYLVIYPQISLEIKSLISKQPEVSNCLSDKIFDLDFGIIPVFRNVWSLYDETATQELFGTKEMYSLNRVASQISRLQSVYGPFKETLVKGDAARKAYELAEEKSTQLL
jgi:hypothetical protein